MRSTLTLLAHPVFLFFLTGCLTTVLIVVFHAVSFKIGLVDLPGGRKKHKKIIPLVGGISIFTASTIVLIHNYMQHVDLFAFWVACFILVAISMVDDKRNLSAKLRFFTQFLSVSITMILGHAVCFDLGNLIGIGPIALGWFSIPFTSFALLGIINAVNMMDGVDGLTGCVSFVELGLMLLLSITIRATEEAIIITVFMGAILAFLMFNLPTPFSNKRKVFLGDSGSMLIGFILSWLSIRLTQRVDGLPAALMLWIVALPLMDTLHLMLDRKIRGYSPLRADRRHIHHILLQLDYSPLQTTLILTFISFFVGTMGIVLYKNGVSDSILFLGILVMLFCYSRFAYVLKKRVANRKHRFFERSSEKSVNL